MTNHQNRINIMVENNSIVFDSEQITKTNSGKGIINIYKRVGHLEGKLTIESEIKKG
jgi:hypothetical protein